MLAVPLISQQILTMVDSGILAGIFSITSKFFIPTISRSTQQKITFSTYQTDKINAFVSIRYFWIYIFFVNSHPVVDFSMQVDILYVEYDMKSCFFFTVFWFTFTMHTHSHTSQINQENKQFYDLELFFYIVFRVSVPFVFCPPKKTKITQTCK